MKPGCGLCGLCGPQRVPGPQPPVAFNRSRVGTARTERRTVFVLFIVLVPFAREVQQAMCRRQLVETVRHRSCRRPDDKPGELSPVAVASSRQPRAIVALGM